MADFDTIVVGGGASGLIAAGYAAKNGGKVLICEKMDRPARKILVTGKGRCNLTNNCDTDTFIKNVKTNPRFLYSAYSTFTSQDTMSLFESLGVPLETQRGNRVFPKSEKAMDIVDAMVKFVRKAGCKIQHDEIDHLMIKDGEIKGVETVSGQKITANNVVIATGGKSYPGTGSTGDGYKFAEHAGHTIKPIRASLVAVDIKEEFCRELMGVSLKSVELSLFERGKKKPIYKELGEMLFTHFGVSGPLVLSASAYMNKPVENYSFYIDFKPALDYQKLDQRILRDFEENTNKDFANSLDGLLPKRLVPIFVELSGIKPYTKVNQITKLERDRLVELFKKFEITPTSKRPIEEAVITAGGVNVKEIDPKTMESKFVKGLYFVGEVLDVDAFTGGFNLQIAFSTGHSAGTAISEGDNQ